MRPSPSPLLKVGAFLALALASAALLRGDDAPATPEAKPIYVVWRAVGFEKALTDYYIKNDGKDVSLDIPPFAASAEYAYRGPNPMAIYRKSAKPAPGKPPAPVATIRFNPRWTQALVFVYPEADGTLGTRTAPNDEENFKPGSIRIFNLTTQPIKLKIGDKEQILAAVHATIFEPEPGTHMIPVRYAFKEKDGWAWKGSNYFSIRQNTRRTVVLIHTEAAFFRAIGSDGTTSAPAALQVFSFSEQCPPGKKPEK